MYTHAHMKYKVVGCKVFLALASTDAFCFGGEAQVSCSDHPSRVPVKSLYHAIKHSRRTIWTAEKLILECFKHSSYKLGALVT